MLGFDLRYLAGWQATMKPQEFQPAGDRLRVVIRVMPEKEGNRPLSLADSLTLPSRDRMGGREIMISGGFALGEGRYQVDWLVRDGRDRYCSSHWSIEVKGGGDFRLAIAPHTATPINPGRGRRGAAPEPAPADNGGRKFKIKILANFSNTNPRRSTLNMQDALAVASILRTVAREPRFDKLTLVAFNMQEERVIYESGETTRIDFGALGEAISGLQLGVIDYERYADKNSGTKFLTRLLSAHLDPRAHSADAVLVVGPKLFLDKKVPKEATEALSGAAAPVFYLNYVASPRMMPWRDTMGSAVRTYGGKEFRITYPKQLAEALGEMLRQLDETKLTGG